MTDSVAQAVRWFTSLRTAMVDGEPRPHKPALLLAVLELAETGHLQDNRVRFEPTLFEYFAEYWEAVADEPTGKIQYPFWYMDSEPFWDLVLHPDFEGARAGKSFTPSVKRVSEWVEYARLDDRLFRAVQDEAARDRLRGVLVAHYFPERADRVAGVRGFEQSVYRYAQLIQASGEPGVAYRSVPEHVRDAAFRRVVTEAYDYTCAVSGARLTLPVGGTYQLVEAAHIHDWAASHDDAPQNGIALSRDYHWMFGRGLFTLDERWRVRVSPAARDCVGTVDRLLSPFDRQPVRLPADRGLWPGQDFLDWHRAERFLAG